MRCDEIQERFVEILYDESAGSSEMAGLQEHLRACPACRKELAELRQTRNFLQLWKDEPPLRSVAAARSKASRPPVLSWRYARYAAIAAMAVLCLLALANTQITWNKEGFSFSTSLRVGRAADRDYYTKSELRDFLSRALDDSESRMSETNYLMMQKMLDMVEQDRWMDLRLIRNPAARDPNKN